MRNVILILVIIIFGSCESEPKKKPLPFEGIKDYENTMILSHQEFLKKEKAKIQNFIDSTGLAFQETGTGLQYYIYEKTNGQQVVAKDYAFVTYTLSSLEGDTFYQSPKGRLQEFIVDYDNVETGLHEGIKKMKVGEKAFLILPAHLAHGISGDNAAIPIQTTLLYNIHLVGKK